MTAMLWRRVLPRQGGLFLFGVGLAVFLLAPLFATFQLERSQFERLAAAGKIDPAHAAALEVTLEPTFGRSFSSSLAFLHAVGGAIEQANLRLPNHQKIWDYNRSQYRLHLADAASQGVVVQHRGLLFWLSVVLASVGALLAFLPGLWSALPGIKNNGVWFSSAKSRGVLGIITGVGLILFYVGLYFFPEYMVNWFHLVDPVAWALKGEPANQWFFYGTLYTFAVLVMGVRMLINYRHSRYHVVRTASVMFFQLGFAFLIPEILASLNKPWFDFKHAWPLDYDFFFGWHLSSLMESGALGWFMLCWGIGLAVLVVPLMAVLVGKRWYCSWVCGCGGLAETLGDPYRHLSNKRLRAWRVERYMVHGVLVLAVAMTAVVLVNFLSNGALLAGATHKVQSWYGFFIGSIFAGVVGTGFYPFMGNRVWCRFGCPLAAILGIVQRFKSRFRITTNGAQCISCGNCSTYCEMGIDVRWYAQRGQNIVRASCVGCGVCASVCPRGVLRLENGPSDTRFNTHSLVQLGNGPIDGPR